MYAIDRSNVVAYLKEERLGTVAEISGHKIPQSEHSYIEEHTNCNIPDYHVIVAVLSLSEHAPSEMDSYRKIDKRHEQGCR
jgi:hypothetical protein